MASRKMKYHVYVIELDNKVKTFRKIQKANPKRLPDMPCVYVGQHPKLDLSSTRRDIKVTDMLKNLDWFLNLNCMRNITLFHLAKTPKKLKNG